MGSTVTPDMTSLYTCDRTLSAFEKWPKMTAPAASDVISRERFVPGPPNFTRLSGTIGLRNLPDMTPRAPSGRLQSVSKYCTKLHKTGPAGHRVYQFGHYGNARTLWLNCAR